MSINVLPLAVTMLVGPGIMIAIVLITSERAVPASVAYVAGFGVAVAIGTAIATGIAALLGSGIDLGDSSDSGSTGTIIQVVLVGLLILASIKQYLGRETAEPPSWLGKMQTATPGTAFKTGLVIVPVMPSDVVIMLTVGTNITQSDSSLAAALPFIGLTTLVAALPLLAYVLFRRRAERAMPKVRDWMNTHSWLVNIIAYGIFIVLILA